LFFICISLKSQTSCMYRLILKDKGNPAFSTEQPEMFLSQNLSTGVSGRVYRLMKLICLSTLPILKQ
jgi:hypothetical protein